VTVKTLFNIILKILGIFFLKDMIASVVQLGFFTVMMRKQYSAGESHDSVKEFSLIFIIIVIYAFFAWLLILKSDWLIRVLRIEKGFDQAIIPLNAHRSTILSIAIIVIGGYMVAEEIPNLCRQLVSYYREKQAYTVSTINISYSISSGIKIVIGLLLMGLQRPIVNLIELKRKDTADFEDETETE
jgi:hypothetical protein